jgi:hypothetical protein
MPAEWLEMPLQLGQLLPTDPFPGVEFRVIGGEIDIGLHAGEPHREPFLAIAAIAPTHYPLGNLFRHIVIKPATAFPKDIGSVGADLRLQLTQRRPARGFASIDAALRHLPLRQPRRHADAVANEDSAVATEQHDANPRTVARKPALRRPHRLRRPHN